MVATVVEVLAADEAQTGRVAVDGKGEGVRRVLRCALEDRRREDQQLVGDWPDRGEHPRSPDDDAVVVFVDNVSTERPAVDLLSWAGRSVGLRRDQRVRGEQILLAHLL